jgi:hypothetical protein
MIFELKIYDWILVTVNFERDDVKQKEKRKEIFKTNVMKIHWKEKYWNKHNQNFCYNDRRFLKENWSVNIENYWIDTDSQFLNNFKFFQSWEKFFILKHRSMKITVHPKGDVLIVLNIFQI